jgi:NarL family two-component system response regulator LiaR
MPTAAALCSTTCGKVWHGATRATRHPHLRRMSGSATGYGGGMVPPQGIPVRTLDLSAVGRITVTLTDESELITSGLRAMLEPYGDHVALVTSWRFGRPADVVLHDPASSGNDAQIDRLLAGGDGSRVVLYTWQVTPALVDSALARGLRGCLSKRLGGEDLVADLLRIVDGEVVVDAGPEGRRAASAQDPIEPLSARELQVVTLITRGFSNQDIARELTLSINSVKSYVRSAYRKMGVTSRSRAVLWGVRHGCLAEPSPAEPAAEAFSLADAG